MPYPGKGDHRLKLKTHLHKIGLMHDSETSCDI
jgi:hypothetical protein